MVTTSVGFLSVCAGSVCRNSAFRLYSALTILWKVAPYGTYRQVCGTETQNNLPFISVHKMTTSTALPTQWVSQLTRLALRYCCGLSGLYSTSFMLCCCGGDRVALTSLATGSSARGEIRSVPVPHIQAHGSSDHSDHHRFKCRHGHFSSCHTYLAISPPGPPQQQRGDVPLTPSSLRRVILEVYGDDEKP